MHIHTNKAGIVVKRQPSQKTGIFNKFIMTYTLRILFVCLFMMLGWQGFTQTPDEVEPYRHSSFVMGVPQHLFVNGLRIEIDKPLGNLQKWLIIAPTLYYKGKQGSWFSSRRLMDGMEGAGLDIMYRYYPSWRAGGGGGYLSAGGGIRYLNFRYSGYRWDEYRQNDLTYYRYDTGSWNRQLTTANIKFTLGYQQVFNRHFAIDLFVGAGFKYTDAKQPADVTIIFDSNDPENLDYTGLLLIGGIRFGMGW